MTKEALKLALEAFDSMIGRKPERVEQAITAIKEALAQPEQEPVAYVKTVIEALYENSDPVSVEAAELIERITTPLQRKPLTDEQISAASKGHMTRNGFARAIEAAHGIKEGT